MSIWPATRAKGGNHSTKYILGLVKLDFFQMCVRRRQCSEIKETKAVTSTCSALSLGVDKDAGAWDSVFTAIRPFPGT